MSEEGKVPERLINFSYFARDNHGIQWMQSIFTFHLIVPKGFLGGSDGKESGDPGSVPVLGRSSGEGNGNPLQYSCLEHPMDSKTQWATVHGSQRVGHN